MKVAGVVGEKLSVREHEAPALRVLPHPFETIANGAEIDEGLIAKTVAAFVPVLFKVSGRVGRRPDRNRAEVHGEGS